MIIYSCNKLKLFFLLRIIKINFIFIKKLISEIENYTYNYITYMIFIVILNYNNYIFNISSQLICYIY